MAGALKKMKEQIKKSGSNKKEILFFGEGTVKRVRFLEELDDAKQFNFHNDYATKVWEPCRDQSGDGDCDCCREGVGIQENFFLSVWDYDGGCVRLVQAKAFGVTPLTLLMEMFEEYGTIMDRDYKIKKVGKGQGSTFVVTPLDKERFKQKKSNPFTEKQIADIVNKAWPTDADLDNEEEETSTPKKKGAKKSKKSKEEPTIEEVLEGFSYEELKEIAISLGMTKKEIKVFEDVEELTSELVDSYEESDIRDVIEEMDEE